MMLSQYLDPFASLYNVSCAADVCAVHDTCSITIDVCVFNPSSNNTSPSPTWARTQAMLFGGLVLSALNSIFGLRGLLNPQKASSLMVFGSFLILLTLAEMWFTVELFTDDVLPTFNSDDLSLYSHIRDVFRTKLECPSIVSRPIRPQCLSYF